MELEEHSLAFLLVAVQVDKVPMEGVDLRLVELQEEVGLVQCVNNMIRIRELVTSVMSTCIALIQLKEIVTLPK